jgi:hypothetical protein
MEVALLVEARACRNNVAAEASVQGRREDEAGGEDRGASRGREVQGGREPTAVE